MIERFFNWLSEHRLVNVVLVFGYALFIVFAHNAFVNLSVLIMNKLSIDIYNTVIAYISFLLASAIAVAVFFGRHTIFNKGALPLVVAALLGLVVHFYVFTEMNIEFIHAIEFGLLGVLLYPLVRRFGAVTIMAFPIICVDEWYQYQVLYSDSVEYFDFNDIQLDLLGIGLFLSLFVLFLGKAKTSRPGLFQRWEFYVLIGLILAVIGSTWVDLVVFYPEGIQHNTWLVLNTIKEPYGFWRVHPLIGSTYHVLEPMTGLIVVFTILFLYQLIDSTRLVK